MILDTLRHEGRRVSYQTVVKIVHLDYTDTEAVVTDDTGLWTAYVNVDARLANRIGTDGPYYFWAKIKGGVIDIKERASDEDGGF